MGKLLAFERRSDDYEDVVELLRKLAAEERAERDCEWLDEATRRASGTLRSSMELVDGSAKNPRSSFSISAWRSGRLNLSIFVLE